MTESYRRAQARERLGEGAEMKSTGMRVVAGIAAVAVAVVLLIVLSDSGEDGGDTSSSSVAESTTTGEANSAEGADAADSTAQTAVPTVVVKNGKPVGGVRNLTYKAGDRVRFRVESDVTDEVHVHGYDISKDVEAGGSVDFDFSADIEGVFEAELEDHGQQILEITVNP